MTRPDDTEARHRLREIQWLLDGGVWPPIACARVGWSVSAAYIAARRRGVSDIARVLSRYTPGKMENAA